MAFIRLKNNGGHYGISKAIGKIYPAYKVSSVYSDVYYVKRDHLTYSGVNPMSGADVFGFVGGVECDRVGVFTAFIDWLIK